MVPAGLPEVIYFRTNTQNFNSHYYTVLRDGHIYIKPNKERTGQDEQWQKMNLPEELEGQVTEIALDGRQMIALDRKRQVYRMDDARGAIKDFYWTKKWGFPFASGAGMKLKTNFIAWDLSVVSYPEDKQYTDSSGNRQGKEISCAHMVFLNKGGQTLTFNDPWLPTDYSYEIGTPYRGRFVSINMSTSGSTHFLINKFGDMFTRLYDFDLSGLHDIFYAIPYSYEDQRGVENPKWQLPPESWKMQPKIDASKGKACITNRITIIKTGYYCVDRMLRVEGTDYDGNTGFYEKDIKEEKWNFHRTDEELTGKILENKHYDSSMETLGESEDLAYSGGDPRRFSIEIPDFNCYNSPADLKIRLSDESEINLLLHYTDTVRIFRRARGINNNPRKFNGAVELPEKINTNLSDCPKSIQDWINYNLKIQGNKRFTKVSLKVTGKKFSITNGLNGKIHWKLNRRKTERT
jgi:hypothetical protein